MLSKNKQRIIGILIFICSYGYIFYRLFNLNIDFTTIQFHSSQLIYFLAAVVLSSLNIYFEAIKWKVLISTFYSFHLGQSIKMILSGFSTGIFTPAKLGEPYGRIIFIPKKHRTISIILNYLSGSIQNIIILLWGLFFFSFISLNKDIRFFNILKYSLFITLLTFLIFITLYKKRNKFYLLFSKYTWSRKLVEAIVTVKYIPFKKYSVVFSLSVIRYIIYCTQLALLLYLFFPSNFNSACIFWIPVYFMFITIIPSFLLADLGIRNSVALFLFSSLLKNDAYILLSVSILWIINQVIPALIGGLLIAKNKK